MELDNVMTDPLGDRGAGIFANGTFTELFTPGHLVGGLIALIVLGLFFAVIFSSNNGSDSDY